MIGTSPESYLVDYASHPAFIGAPVRVNWDESAIKQILLDVEASFLRIKERSSSPAEADVSIANDLNRRIDDLNKEVISKLSEHQVLTQVLQLAFSNFRERLRGELMFHLGRTFDGTRLNRVEQGVLDDLRRDGISVLNVDPKELLRIKNSAQGYMESVKRSPEVSKGDRIALSLPFEGSYWPRIVDLMKESSMLGAAAGLQGYPLEVIYCSLTYSHAGQHWWKSCYDDVGLPTSKSAYLHRDNDYEMMKAIIYLDEVAPEHGPFSYIKGSYNEPRVHVQDGFFKVLDKAFAQTIRPLVPPTDIYYRKWFKYPEFRADFISLPSALRGTSHFGDDLLDGSTLQQHYLSEEVQVTSDKGNAFVFVGNNLVHRGGCLDQGERWAIQMGFYVKPPLITRLRRDAKRGLRKTALKVISQQNYDRIKRTVKPSRVK